METFYQTNLEKNFSFKKEPKFILLSENSEEKYIVLVIFFLYVPFIPFGFTVKIYHSHSYSSFVAFQQLYSLLFWKKKVKISSLKMNQNTLQNKFISTL